jgi:hypothetical protein
MKTTRRLNPDNACYHLVQNLLSSCLLSRSIKIRIHKTMIMPVVLYGCETWYLTLREEHRLRCWRTEKTMILPVVLYGCETWFLTLREEH